jgi:predicted nucleic acid-binding protein
MLDSSITLAELRFGAETRRSRKLHRLVGTFVEAVAVVPFDQPAADRFGVVAASLARLAPAAQPERWTGFLIGRSG